MTDQPAEHMEPAPAITRLINAVGIQGEAYIDTSATPRRVPTMAERVGCGHTPEQHRHDDGQAADDASHDRAIREITTERDEALTSLRDVLDELANRTTEIRRLRHDLDSTQQVATFRQGVINLHAAELGAAGEVLAVVRDAQERIERALARYDTAPEVTPVEPDDEAEAPLGSVSPRAQDDEAAVRRRHALAFNALSRTLLDIGPFVPLSVREQCTEAVLGALDAQAHESEQALRDRLEHAIRARLEQFAGTSIAFLDGVAAVAAVAAVGELGKP
ncbi:hypothetical protein ACLQ25_09600 [Micromonospora sp. DT44]|uniref:hypothetical protein n=1 Tax=Micromonospora sp. DT44 TaxID=3393439 RepID=UPI003CF273FE